MVDNTKVYMMDGSTTLAAVIANVNVKASAPSTSVGTGEIIYRSDVKTLFVNTGSAGAPNWVEVGSGTSDALPLAGGTMAGEINMNSNKIALTSDGNVFVKGSGESMTLQVDTGGSLIIQIVG